MDSMTPEAVSVNRPPALTLWAGVRGWGAKGELDLDRIRELAEEI